MGDSWKIVFDHNFTIYNRSVTYLVIPLSLAGPDGQISTSLGQIVPIYILVPSANRSSSSPLSSSVWPSSCLFLDFSFLRAEMTRFFDCRVANFTSKAWGVPGVPSSAGSLTLPTRWEMAISSSVKGGWSFIRLLHSRRAFWSVVPGVVSESLNILTESFRPCCSRLSTPLWRCITSWFHLWITRSFVSHSFLRASTVCVSILIDSAILPDMGSRWALNTGSKINHILSATATSSR